jgi:SAM-dependent methyltransferase
VNPIATAGATKPGEDGLVGVLQTYWEKVAATRWGAYVSEIEKQAILQAQSMAGKPGRALEMGCEGGRWSKLLADLGWQMTCVDVDPQTMAVCQRKVPAARCILRSPRDETIPCEADSMDLLVCVEVAPVIQSDWFLPEAGRVLCKNGILVGVCWNRTSARGVFSRVKQRLAPDTDTAFYSRSYSGWRKDLGRAGFQLVHEEGFCWSPFGRASNSPLVPFFTRLERLLGLHRMTKFSPWIVFVARKFPREPGAKVEAKWRKAEISLKPQLV